jgi:cell division protein FtsA
LHGAREFAGLILDKQVRIVRPQRIAGLAEATGGPAFATTAGLMHFALSERAEVSGMRHLPERRRRGVFGRLGHWLKENF